MSAAPQRRIALLHSSTDDSADSAPLRLVESMLWAFQGTTRSSWVRATSPESADVAVVSSTAPNERIDAWRKSGKPLIVITAPDAPPVRDEHVLVYPFRATQFLQLLNTLDARLGHSGGHAAPAANQPDIASSPASESSTTNRDSWSFVEALRTLREVQNTEVWLTGYYGPTPRLWIKGDGSEYTTDPATLQDIRRGTFRFGAIQMRRGVPPPPHRQVRSAAELQWFAGCHAGATLAPDLDEFTRYRISRWPNFGLIRPLPSQIRVTALLAASPLDLRELVKRSALPAEEVIRTLNALEASGLLHAVQATAAPAPMPAAEVPQMPGGFGSFVRLLRKRLGLSEST